MRPISLTILLTAMWMQSAVAASLLKAAFDQARTGRPMEECFQQIDLAKIDLSEEAQVILEVLNGTDRKLARRAAGVVLAVLLLRHDTQTKRDARSMGPALIAHYNDLDPDQPPPLNAPTDSWRQVIMHFIINSDLVPSPELVDKMLSDLNRKGDAFGATAGLAAMTLSHLNPIPPRVLDSLMKKMDESSRSRIEVIEAFGANRIQDPRAIARIVIALESRAGSDPRDTNELRRVAARALGLIGPPAKIAIPALRRIVSNMDPSIEEFTREAALDAIRLVLIPN